MYDVRVHDHSQWIPSVNGALPIYCTVNIVHENDEMAYNIVDIKIYQKIIFAYIPVIGTTYISITSSFPLRIFIIRIYECIVEQYLPPVNHPPRFNLFVRV